MLPNKQSILMDITIDKISTKLKPSVVLLTSVILASCGGSGSGGNYTSPTELVSTTDSLAQAQISDAQKAVDTAKRQALEAQAAAKAAKQEADQAKAEAQTAKQQAEQAGSDNTKLTQALQKAEAAKQSAETAATAAQTAKAAAEETLAKAQAAAQQAIGAAKADAQAQVDQAKAEVAVANEALQAAEQAKNEALAAKAQAEAAKDTAVKQAQAQISDAQKAVDTAKRQALEAQAAAKAAKQEADQAKAEAQTAKQQAEQAGSDNTKLTQALQKAEAAKQSAETAATAAQTAKAAAEETLAKAQAAAQQAIGAAKADAQAQVDQAKAEVAVANEALQAAEQAKNEALAAKAQAEAAKDTAVKQAQAQISDAQKAVDTAKRQALEAQAAAKAAKQEADQAKAEAQTAKQQAEQAGSDNTKLTQALQKAEAAKQSAETAATAAQTAKAAAEETLAKAQAAAQQAIGAAKADAQAQVDQAKAEVAVANEALQAAEQAKNEALAAKAQAEAAKDTAVKQAQAQISDAQKAVDTAKRQALEAQAAAKAAKQEADQAKAEAQTAKQQAEQAGSDNTKLTQALQKAEAAKQSAETAATAAQTAKAAAEETLAKAQAAAQQAIGAAKADAQAQVDQAKAEVAVANEALQAAEQAKNEALAAKAQAEAAKDTAVKQAQAQISDAQKAVDTAKRQALEAQAAAKAAKQEADQAKAEAQTAKQQAEQAGSDNTKLTQALQKAEAAKQSAETAATAAQTAKAAAEETLAKAQAAAQQAIGAAKADAQAQVDQAKAEVAVANEALQAAEQAKNEALAALAETRLGNFVSPDSVISGAQIVAVGTASGVFTSSPDNFDMQKVNVNDVSDKSSLAPLDIQLRGEDDTAYGDVEAGLKQHSGSLSFKGYDGVITLYNRSLNYDSIYKNFDEVMQIGHINGDIKSSIFFNQPLATVYAQGRATNLDDFNELAVRDEGKVNYKGMATYKEQDTDVVSGSSDFDVDFINKSVNGTLKFKDADYQYMPEGNEIAIQALIEGNKFQGSSQGIETSGGFYGSGAKYLGGVYANSGDNKQFIGTYGAKKIAPPINPDTPVQDELTGFQSNTVSNSSGFVVSAKINTDIHDDKSDWIETVEEDGQLIAIDNREGDNFTSYDSFLMRSDMTNAKKIKQKVAINIKADDDASYGNGFKLHKDKTEVKGSSTMTMDYTTIYKDFDGAMQLGHVYGEPDGGFWVGKDARLSTVFAQGNATSLDDMQYMKDLAQYQIESGNSGDGKVSYEGVATYLENIHQGDKVHTGPVVDGVSKFDVDFVGNSVKGELSFDQELAYNSSGKVRIEAVIDGNQFSGNTNNIDASGSFYGEDAKYIGGVYQQVLTEGGKGDEPGTATTFQGTYGATQVDAVVVDPAEPEVPAEPKSNQSGVQTLQVAVDLLNKKFATTTRDFEVDNDKVVARTDIISNGLLPKLDINFNNGSETDRGFNTATNDTSIKTELGELPVTYQSVYKNYDDQMMIGQIAGNATFASMEIPLEGAFAVGNATATENMPSEGRVLYSGDATYRDMRQADKVELGESSFVTDFVAKEMTGSLNFADNKKVDLSARIEGNQFSGTARNNKGFETSGSFYGDLAEHLGGTYQGNHIIGSYGASKQETPAPDVLPKPEPVLPVNVEVAPDTGLSGFQSNTLSSSKGSFTDDAIGYVQIRNDKSDWDETIKLGGQFGDVELAIDNKQGDNFTSYDSFLARVDMINPDSIKDKVTIAVKGEKDTDYGDGFKEHQDSVTVQGPIGLTLAYSAVYKDFDSQMQIGHVYGDPDGGFFVGKQARFSNVFSQGNATDLADMTYMKNLAQYNLETGVNDGLINYTGVATYMENLHLGDGARSGPITNGTSTFDVDFISNTLTGELSFAGDFKYNPSGKVFIEANIEGNTFAGDANNIDTAGGFYGEDAKYIGGIYQQALDIGGKGDVPGTGTAFQGTFGAEKQ
ncbi:transferrin-binding protein-like solute binding protein [Psychrobacter sp. FDAARGOS_221]|uniref:transferrin-binding protein-like solute binding protein n=1 Tax=Psychrobacter sp. FDAARGOS_221 TaxID=1975705 RepID=UPI000BB582DC|nr:transferrin-binding protein-like solute binding protein [Psychrobacter sp. FDAARGOS_221]PNK61331.1 hypothetical protein A6J60_010955 [Psychrobacter sp. FDAARGOS_221]